MTAEAETDAGVEDPIAEIAALYVEHLNDEHADWSLVVGRAFGDLADADQEHPGHAVTATDSAEHPADALRPGAAGGPGAVRAAARPAAATR